MRSFAPISAATVSLGADTSSDSVAFSSTGMPSGEFQVRCYNSGAVDAFVDFGEAGLTIATTTAMPIPGGAVEVLTVPNPQKGKATTAYAMTATGTATVYFTPGHGI